MSNASTPDQPAPSSAADNAAALRGKPADPGQPLDRYEQSQVRFRTVFENAPLGQKIITPDLTIRQANPAVVKMLGCAGVDDLVGRKIIEFAHPEHRADWQDLQERLWTHKMPSFTLETCMLRTDGSSFWCKVHSVLFPDDDGELGYTILEDISDRKNLESKLKRVYDAQETILQLATHDIKGPIAHIEPAHRPAAARSGQPQRRSPRRRRWCTTSTSSRRPAPTPTPCCRMCSTWATSTRMACRNGPPTYPPTSRRN
ncbi:PAS domain-containing protein [Hymenobacter humi]|uniref:PAS domain-containing protein n=1 Tax=Hymenobacter humi TaxID=1411620 RepID=A0ABW2UCY7_9BACT